MRLKTQEERLKMVNIEVIDRQSAMEKKLIAPLLKILNAEGISGYTGTFTEKTLLATIAEGNIWIIKFEEADKPEILGAILVKAKDTTNEFGLFSLAYKPNIQGEIIKESLRELQRFAYIQGITKASLILANKAIIELLEDSGFVIEATLQRALKTPEGFHDAWLCSTSTNGREIKPLALAESPITGGSEKDEIISGLKSQLEALNATLQTKEEIIKNLRDEEMKLQKLLNEATKPISGQRIQKAEIEVREKETTPRAKLEQLISQLGLTKRQKKILENVIQHPEIQSRKLEKLTGLSPANISQIGKELEELGLITKTPDLSDKRIKHWHPTKKATGEINESAQEAKEAPTLIAESAKNSGPKRKITLSNTEQVILELLMERQDGIYQHEIVKATKINKATVSYIARKLAKLGLATNKKVGRESLVKPIMEKVAEHFLEMTKSLNGEKSETSLIKIAPVNPHQKIDSDLATKEETILISAVMTEEEGDLLSSLSPQRKEKGVELINSALDRNTCLSDLAAQCKTKMSNINPVLQALCKKINVERKKAGQKTIGVVTIQHDEEKGKDTFRIHLETDSKKKGGTGTISSKDEKIRESPKTLKLTITDICKRYNFGEAQARILVALKEAGGTLPKDQLKLQGLKLSDIAFESYLSDLRRYKVIKIDGGVITLAI